MKKILYILMIGLFSSCDSLLNVEPETLVSYDNFYKSEQDLEVTLYQLHSFVNSRLLDFKQQEKAGLLMESTYTQEHIWDPINIVGSPAIGAIFTDWAQIYWVVYMSNVLLDNMYKAESKVTPERMDFYRAQAYFGKALGYFFLVRRWGEVPITRNSTSSEIYGKKPLLEVLDTVISNATRAYNMLPVQEALMDRTGAAITSKQFGSKGTACALLAHAYAWKGSMIDLMELEGNSRECYTKSIEYASHLIKGDAGSYSLVRDPESLARYFSTSDVNNPESIFEFTLDLQNDYISSLYLVGSDFIGYPVNPEISEGDHKWSRDAKLSYNTIRKLYEPQDLRKKANFYKYDYYSLDSVIYREEWVEYITDEHKRDSARLFKQDSINVLRNNLATTTGASSVTAGDGYAYPYKWRTAVLEANPYLPGQMKLVAIKSNYSYWRLSEIYLLRAECNAKIGENGLAQMDLNEIRGINQATLFPGGEEDDKGLKYAIFHERERELLMEGQRFFDVVRNGMEYINTYLPGMFKTLTSGDVKDGALFLPIYSSAFEMNDLLRQNVYWAKYMN